MGGRQSSQSHHQRHRSPSEGSSRYSVGSLDNGDLLSGPSGNIDLSVERPISRRRRRRDRNDQFIEAHSLPAHLFPFVTAEIKCPVCNKRIGTNEIESHLLVCLAKPRVSYNEDVLKADAGECIICFEDMITGEHIARLPCLCIYHKKCLDEWFSRNRCCPAHPDQIPQEYADGTAENPSAVTTTSSSATTTIEADPSSPTISPTLANDVTVESIQNTSPGQNSLITSPNLVAQAAGGDSGDGSFVELTNDSLSSVLLGDSMLSGEDTDHVTANNSLVADRGLFSDVPGSSSSPYEISPRDLHSQSDHLAIGKTVVHVDDGSIHGSPGMFDDDEIAQLASKIKTILVQESPRGREFEGT